MLKTKNPVIRVNYATIKDAQKLEDKLKIIAKKNNLNLIKTEKATPTTNIYYYIKQVENKIYIYSIMGEEIVELQNLGDYIVIPPLEEWQLEVFIETLKNLKI